MALKVRTASAAEVLPLRGAVLRGGAPHEGFAEDDLPGTFHLAAEEDGRIVGVATFLQHDVGVWQLRGMAVEQGRQGSGIGRLLLDDALVRLRALGATALWANGRDTALGFYERLGWRVVGGGFANVDGLPHHRVELDLRA